MAQQGALARRADAGNLLQAGLAQVALAPGAVRADREAVRLVAQALQEIQHRITRRQPNRFAPRNEEGLPAGIPVRPLGDRDERDVAHAKLVEGRARGTELTQAAVD